MARAIFKVFFKIIVSVTNAILSPVNAIVSGLFPDLSIILTRFAYAVNNYIGSGLTWFWSIIPNTCKSLLTIYLTILVAYYTISITLHVILKVYTIIKNIKIW